MTCETKPRPRARVGRGRLRLTLLLVLPYLAPARAGAQQPTPSDTVLSNASSQSDFYTLFVAGPSPGVPSASKTATVASFYALAGASLASAALFTYWYVDARNAEQRIDAAGACTDVTSTRCSRLLDARHERREHASWAGLSGGATLTFLLAGLVTAHYWENTEATAAITSTDAFVQWQLRF